MSQSPQVFNAKAFSTQPGYDEPSVREEFSKLMPLRTVVIYCFDPRAAAIPEIVAKEFGVFFPAKFLRILTVTGSARQPRC
jgi:carbonic anhydrase